MNSIPQAILESLTLSLIPLYTAEERHYHNLTHIESCLALFWEYRKLFTHPNEAGLALWFQDAIYDPTRSDNEEQSAALARKSLTAHHLPEETIARIETYILATKHTAPPTDNDTALITDIDLSILGSDPKTFDTYEQAIRSEYNHIPEAQFRQGRAKFLQHFLSRPHIYTTPNVRQRFELQAHQNLTRSLNALTTN